MLLPYFDKDRNLPFLHTNPKGRGKEEASKMTTTMTPAVNPFLHKLKKRLLARPDLWFSLLAKPTPETLWFIRSSGLGDRLGAMLSSGQPWICNLYPLWEQQACQGSDNLKELLELILQPHPDPALQEDRVLRSDLLRMYLLASTPGRFPFSPSSIQERLLDFLPSAYALADLSELGGIFSPDEILPLSKGLKEGSLSPHSTRYLQNLFYPERQRLILAALAYIAKNYALLEICRSAYVLMLSLNDPLLWGQHPFCQRLAYNHLRQYQSRLTDRKPATNHKPTLKTV